MTAWNCLHLYPDADGVSRVDADHSIELSLLDFAPPAPPMSVARIAETQGFALVELPVGWQGGWHPSPSKQWVMCLGGHMGYQAGDGSTFALTAGSCILTTDTRGRGHNSWNAGSEPVRLAIVQVS
jgi:hypothetical protein